MKIPYQLRPATMEDRSFMMHLEKLTFAKYIEDIEQWEEHQKKHYDKHFRPKYVSIIEYFNQPIGAVSVMVRRKEIYIVYLYILPEFQNKDIDESLIKNILNRAKQEHKSVITCMFKGETRTKRMCARLGFKVFAEDDLRWRVKWIP